MIQLPNGDWVNPKAVTCVKAIHDEGAYVYVMNTDKIKIATNGNETSQVLRDRIAAMVGMALDGGWDENRRADRGKS